MNLMESIRSRDMDLGELWEEHRSQIVTSVAAALVVALLASGSWWFFAGRWKAPPSIFDSPVDNVLGYFTTDDFNLLSVDERITAENVKPSRTRARKPSTRYEIGLISAIRL